MNGRHLPNPPFSVAARRLALLLLPLLGACARQPAAPPERPPLAGSSIGGPFALTDQHGRTVTDRSLAGRYRIMYFGYTFCPDVCPTDMAHIAAATALLRRDDPALARRVVPVFVSVDPARDTPAVLAAFAANFGPGVVALTGSADAIARVAREYGVYFKKGEPTAGGGYMVDHTVAAYLMDPAGRPLALLPVESADPAPIVAEIRRWAGGTGPA